MGDLIVDFIGALAIAIAGYLSRTRGKGNLVHGLILKRRSPEREQEPKAGAPKEEGAGSFPVHLSSKSRHRKSKFKGSPVRSCTEEGFCNPRRRQGDGD